MVSETARVRIRTKHPELACASAAEPVEDYVDYLEHEFASYRAVVTPTIDLSVYLQSSEMPRACSRAKGCASGTVIAQRDSSWLPHELVHAVAHQYGGTVPLLAEGLATYFDPDGWLGAPVDKSIDLASYADVASIRRLRESDLVGYAQVVGAAASLTGLVVRSHDLATFLAVYDAVDEDSTAEELSAALLEETGLSLEAWLAAWRLDAASDTVRSFPESFACSQSASEDGASIPLSCGLHPLARTSQTQGAYASTLVSSPGLVALEFSSGATGPSSRSTSCEDGSPRGLLFGFEPVRHLHLHDVTPGAFGLEVDSLGSEPSSFVLRMRTDGGLDLCQAGELVVSPGTIVRWALADTGTSHPTLGAASGAHFVLAEAASLRMNVPDAAAAHLCDSTCDAAGSCSPFASLADPDGVVPLAQGADLYVVVPQGSGRATITLAFE